MEESLIQISGVAIRLRPEFMGSVKSKLNTINGLEIHAEDMDSGRLAITLEDRDTKEMTEAIAEIEAIEGVVMVNPVYIHDETEMAKPS